MRDFNNTLFLEARGCYFHSADDIGKASDVGNYRVCTTERIKAHNGREYWLEFGHYDRRATRTTHKTTGRPLKHPKTEIVLYNALHIDTEFETADGSWRDCHLEAELHSRRYTYNKADILAVVNEISADKTYTDIVIVNRSYIIDEFAKIYNIGGYRERAIIDNLSEVKRGFYNSEHRVYTFIGRDGATFEYDYTTGKITG